MYLTRRASSSRPFARVHFSDGYGTYQIPARFRPFALPTRLTMILRSALLLILVLPTLPARAQPSLPRFGEVTTGAQRLLDTGFVALDGLRIGLVTNHT